jgi:hypothetical protein
MSGRRSDLAIRAELIKLARMLDGTPEELAYLEPLAAEELRALREQVTEVLFDAGSALGRLAAASRLLPVGAIAKISEQAFGPVLTARIAGLIDPGRAAEVASRLPAPFLAEVAVHLDPRRAAALLGQIPAPRIAEVARLLGAAGEDVALSRFADHLGGEPLALALRELDDLTVVRVALMLESRPSAARTLHLLAPGRLPRVIAVVRGTDLEADAAELLSQAQAPPARAAQRCG